MNQYTAIIVTALPVEYIAARAHLYGLREETYEGTVYEIGSFQGRDAHWEILLAEIGAGGNRAALEAERAIRYFEPSVAIFLGVAGGVKDVTIGDVVAATKIYSYESGKADSKFRPRPDVGKSSHAMEQRARSVARNQSWLKRISEPIVNLTPRAFVGAIAAGEKVIASTESELYSFLKENYGDALAVEMEGHGFLSTAHANPRVLALVVRGISDMINNKSDFDDSERQKIAAHNASAFVFELLANLSLPEPITVTDAGRDSRRDAEAYVQSSIHLNSLPAMSDFVLGRDNDIAILKGRLITGVGPYHLQVVVAMRGWPGIGKTTVATALAWDNDIYAAFPDGILWATLGQKPNLISQMADWGLALGTDSLLAATSLKEACESLRATLRNKRILLVLDDVWDLEHVAPFRLAQDKNNALLITTREMSIIDGLSIHSEAIYNLPPLTEEASIEMLRVLASNVVTEYPDECLQLVRALQCLPLALRVAGRLLNSESRLEWGISDLLSELSTSSRLIQEKVPSSQIDLDTQTIPTVAALLKKSTDRLSPEMERYFAFLAPFQPMPATFGLDALRYIWKVEDPKPIVRTLVGHGLLEPIGGRFQIHSLLIRHAQSLLNRGAYGRVQ